MREDPRYARMRADLCIEDGCGGKAVLDGRLWCFSGMWCRYHTGLLLEANRAAGKE